MKGNITVRSHHGRSCIAKSIFACYYKIVYILVKIAVETNVCVIGIIYTTVNQLKIHKVR